MYRARAGLLSWCAGLFDADGCFTLYWEHSKRSKQFPYMRSSATLEIREKSAVDIFQKLFGGSVNKKKPRKSSHSPTHVWRATARSLDDFITKIRPYLLLKAAQADVIKSARSVRTSKASSPVTDLEYLTLLDHKFWMEEFNKTGVGK